jgi:hypothetical protein
MKAPVTVDVALLAKALGMSYREGIQALRAGLKDAQDNLRGIHYQPPHGPQDPFFEWCYQLGQEIGFKLREQRGYVPGAQLMRPTPMGGWVIARRNKGEKRENP